MGTFRDWRHLWKIVYHYVGMHQTLPEQFPLHANFWGYHRSFGRVPNKPFPERILEIGAAPAKGSIIWATNCGGDGQTDEWLRRRVAYIEGKPGLPRGY